FARQIFSHFDDKTIVGIGAGEIAKVVLPHLQQLQPGRLCITHRSMDNARALAKAIAIDEDHAVRPFEQLDDLLVEADVVLSSTGARQPII
ncbi:glutamyl-tRNA reductase, partial [Enterococcus hirae]